MNRLKRKKHNELDVPEILLNQEIGESDVNQNGHRSTKGSELLKGAAKAATYNMALQVYITICKTQSFHL